jgi:hypothetical protein
VIVPLFYPPDYHGTYVIVEAPTGIVYQTQVGGHACDQKTLEGFLLPCHPADHDDTRTLENFFHETFRGFPPITRGREWNPSDLHKLREIVSQFIVGCAEAESAYSHLTFDDSRSSQATEGWLPVLTPWGPGILVHENSD